MNLEKKRERDGSTVGWEKREDLLAAALDCWESLSSYRRERERNKLFTYGDQWSDIIEIDGMRVREEEYIRAQGNVPLKNNMIRRIVRNVLGVFRSRYEERESSLRSDHNRGETERLEGAEAGLRFREEKKQPEGAEAGVRFREEKKQPEGAEAGVRFREEKKQPEKAGAGFRAGAAAEIEVPERLRINREVNMMEEIYARSMEEFLIGGMAVHRKWFGVKDRTLASWTDIVAPDNFFFDTSARDFRNHDIRLVGEIHYLDIESLCATFANSEADCVRLRKLYGQSEDKECKVVEVWRREYRGRYVCHDRGNGRIYEILPEDLDKPEIRRRSGREERRWMVKEVWMSYFLAPGGEVLQKGESPYHHGSHPYVFKAYPYIDGEIHSFVGDIIDQQKFTNRLISMYDWILRASAKGVLLFPEGALPEGSDINDIAEEWSRFNGVILFRPRAGQPLPQQVSSNCTNIGITELLDIQLKMMEDISGVNGALQGKLESSSMSGTLYTQQTQNALISLTDLLKSYDSFIDDATRRDISNLRQFGC